ncbi:MAG: cytochrome bd-I oxidase subunit CydX [Psychrobacter sp.]|uniref:cytochrome bd-I oxidase subunit CydX n=1 Tax=unclassified Psychrobacter TaxID=196806 RepID=UPI001787CC61|nr:MULTISPECIES: cytochrome bd-I oxidase subunit CydX [unclassified Psychrobacter]MBE0441103.1 cytochrome bd-I oxidase subunit CydX [Psychrobacter sp. FME13]
MWYFAWVLGLGFAVLLAIVNAIWLEHEQGRLESFSPKQKQQETPEPEKLPE